MHHSRRVVQRLRVDRERGETLLELIVAITILGVCVVALGSGIALSVTISVVHRSQATAQDSLRNYAETLQNFYTPCTATSTPDYAASLIVPPGFSPPAIVVDYWLPTTATFTSSQTCPPGGDTGLQQIKLTLVSTSGKVSESLVVDVRRSS
jgi:prepilin-type N-terminal cleavage/methylation domain-containing protein